MPLDGKQFKDGTITQDKMGITTDSIQDANDAVTKEYVDNNQSIEKQSIEDNDIQTLDTAYGDGVKATNHTLSQTPVSGSGVDVYLNGGLVPVGTTNEDYGYFTGANGGYPRPKGGEREGDEFYWNSSSAKVSLDTDDSLSYKFITNGGGGQVNLKSGDTFVVEDLVNVFSFNGANGEYATIEIEGVDYRVYNESDILVLKDNTDTTIFTFTNLYDNTSIDQTSEYNITMFYDGQGSLLFSVYYKNLPWKYIEKIISDEASVGDYFGNSVAIDGDLMIVGAFFEDTTESNSGAAYVFKRDNGLDTWSHVQKLKAITPGNGDRFGYSVAIDGDFMVIGAPYESTTESNSGASYVFKRDNGLNTWSQVQKLKAITPGSSDYFGHSVAIDGDFMVIGAYYESTTENNSGAAYVFKRDNGLNTWSQVQKLKAITPGNGDRFGSSVDIEGDFMVIGAPYESTIISDSGASYVFKRDNGLDTWSQVQKLKSDNITGNDKFGTYVAINDYFMVIGIPNERTTAQYSGAVGVFKRDGNDNWNQVQTLKADTPTYFAQFGLSVDIEGDFMVIGAPGDGTEEYDSGFSYIFKRDTGFDTWSLVQNLYNEDPDYSDQFGKAVCIDGEFIAIGEAGDNISGIGGLVGSVSIFKINE